MFTFALLTSGIILLIFLPFSTFVLRLCQVPNDLITISDLYFKLQIIEQVIIIFNNIFIGLEKSKGNTKIIFILNIIIMGVKLILNSIFIYGFHVTNLAWIEVASIVAQLVLFVIAMIKLFSKDNIFKISFKTLSLKWNYLKKNITSFTTTIFR